MNHDSTQTKTSAGALTPPSAAHIVLVDDDKFILDMYSAKFAQKGYVVEGCLSAEDALRVLRGGFLADIIIFDLTMQGRDGFSFLQTLKGERLSERAIKVALTNQSADPEKAKAMELGVDRYIVKASVIPSEVVNIIAEELAKKTARA